MLPILREYCTARYRTLVYPRLEADDVLGICGTYEPLFEEPIIYSIDKDMHTLPANLWSNDERFFYPQAERVADWYWMMQTLTGDPTDGYPGCPGIGKKRAADMLGEPGERSLDDLWDQVVRIYESKDLTQDDALAQARCARILRNTDFTEGEIKLWQPTS